MELYIRMRQYASGNAVVLRNYLSSQRALFFPRTAQFPQAFHTETMCLTEKIIEIVQRYPILYDLSHVEYKNIRKKDKVWDEIGLELKENGEEIKKKWRNLRDTYAKYLRSVKTRTGQAAKKNYKNWQWSKQMEFLRSFLAFADTDSNVRGINEEEISVKNQVSQIREISNAEDYEVLSVESSPAPVHQKSDNQSIESTPTTQPTKETYSSKQNLKKRKILEPKSCPSVDRVVHYLENKRKCDGKTANDLIFSGYAKTVNSFSLKRQSITRMKIAQIIAEQELKHIEEMESMSMSSSSASGFLSPSPTPLPTAHSPSSVYIDNIPILMEANLSSGQTIYTSDESNYTPHISSNQPNYTSTEESNFTSFTTSEQPNLSVQSFVSLFHPSKS